jgi:hypothetical protein
MRARVRAIADTEQRKSHEMRRVELGYVHLESQIIAAENGDPPNNLARDYEPTTWPGAHLPHFWLAGGSSIYDRLGTGFALIAAGRDDVGASQDLGEAYAQLGAPFTTVSVPASASQILKRRFVLVRPDLHVVWRGNEPPPAELARLSLGFSTAAAQTPHYREQAPVGQKSRPAS